MDFFSEIKDSMNSMLSDDQKQDLQEMGKKFYGNIDMDKYKPIPKEEYTDDFIHDLQELERIKYFQLQKAVQSGLDTNDFTEEEMQIWMRFN